MNYYEKYLKYKKKYHILKNQQINNQTSGSIEYPVQNYVPAYAFEVRDYNHRPSSHENNFEPLFKVYANNNSIPFKNNYYVDFIDVYNKNEKMVTYLTDEELTEYECVLADNKITSPYIRNIIKKNIENGKQYKRLIYVSDMFGRVYVIDKTKTSRAQVNHTTLSKGKLVSSAGFITINNLGNIIEISNLTGHYQSGEISIYNFIHILVSHGFDIDNIKLAIHLFIKNQPKGPYCYNCGDWFRENQQKLSSISLSIVDKINYLISTNIYNLQIKADFLNIESTTDLHSFYLIFHSNDSMYEFVSRNNLTEVFNLNPEDNTLIENNKKYFVDKKFDLFEITSSIITTDVKIVITYYQALQDYYSPKKIVKQKRNNMYWARYLKDESECKIYYLNKKINDNLYLSEEYLLLKIDENILVGNIGFDLLKDYYKIIYSLGFYWTKFIKPFGKTILELFILEKNKCEQDISSLNRLTDLTDTYDEYKKVFCKTTDNINFIGSNLWKPDFGIGFIESFEYIKPNDVVVQFSEMGEKQLLDSFILFSEKLIMEYFSSATIQTSNLEITLDIEPLSIVLFRKRVNVNNREHNVIEIIENSINTISRLSSAQNLKINGRHLSLENICKYLEIDDVCLNMSEPNFNMINPCIDIAKIIAQVLLKTDLSILSFANPNGIITYNYETSLEQNIILKIIIHGILVKLFSLVPDKTHIAEWDVLLRNSVFIELMRLRTGRTDHEKKIIESLGLEILNKINQFKANTGIPKNIIYFNQLINEAKYILQV